MNPASVHRWFKRCLERAGLSTEWGLHDLRHAAANALYGVTGDVVLANNSCGTPTFAPPAATCTRTSNGSRRECGKPKPN
jgi:hypothetical protein